MHVGHILLSRPWQFDRKVMHDGYKNRYSFDMNGRKFTLAPLIPMQVYKDQVRINKFIEEKIQREAKQRENKKK